MRGAVEGPTKPTRGTGTPEKSPHGDLESAQATRIQWCSSDPAMADGARSSERRVRARWPAAPVNVCAHE